MPSSVEDVAEAIRIIHAFNVTFAVRAGGHSPNPGWSSIGKGGLLLDLQRMDTITLSTDNTIVSVGPGARWGAVQDVLQDYGATVVGGRISDVGVSGLLLGGEFLFSSSSVTGGGVLTKHRWLLVPFHPLWTCC